MKFRLRASLVSEFLGTALLVAAVAGSGIMGERLAGGNVAIALLANTIATGAALLALILTFGPISGAHFNPAVTLADAVEHGVPWKEVPTYIIAQCAGGVVGAGLAHLMFGLRLYSFSAHTREGRGLVLSEFVATFGLLSVIWGCSRLCSSVAPFVVASYITAAYWFTASPSFANPSLERILQRKLHLPWVKHGSRPAKERIGYRRTSGGATTHVLHRLDGNGCRILIVDGNLPVAEVIRSIHRRHFVDVGAI